MKSGFKIVDAFNARGRKSIEVKLPRLIEDIKDIVDSQAQTDPSFKTTRLFTRITVKEVNDLTPPGKHKLYEDIHSDFYEVFDDYPAYQKFKELFEVE